MSISISSRREIHGMGRKFARQSHQKMNFQHFADKAIAGQVLSQEECQAVLRCPDQHILALLDAAYQVRYHFCGKSVHLHMLINAKSGLCPEDCHYCSQSKISTADIEKDPLASQQKLLEGGKQPKESRRLPCCSAIRTDDVTRRWARCGAS